jgi:hypothetical protein
MWENLFDFVLQKLPYYYLVKSYLSYCVDWPETWHRLDRERISILGEILLQTTVMIRVQAPVCQTRSAFVLLLFIRGKNCSQA